MKRVLDIHPEATDEATAGVQYYEQCELGMGTRFRTCLSDAYEEILLNPLLCRKRPGGFRRYNLPVFPYYIAFFVFRNRIYVAAVAHNSRHPDYWKGREP